jgi:hypothetical protein
VIEYNGYLYGPVLLFAADKPALGVGAVGNVLKLKGLGFMNNLVVVMRVDGMCFSSGW